MSFHNEREQEPSVILNLQAKRYLEAAGKAFSEGSEEKAHAFRDAGRKLLEMSKELPRLLPEPTVPTPRNIG